MKSSLHLVLIGTFAFSLVSGCTEAELESVEADPTSGDAPADPSDATDSSEPEEVEEIDRSDEVYDRTRLLDVRIEMSPADWEDMRTQTRTGADLGITEDCTPSETPMESPFTWFQGRAIVDGEVFQDVGLRKKGFLVLSTMKNPPLRSVLINLWTIRNF